MSESIVTLPKKKISMCVTTYGTQSLYTSACLESIRQWKSRDRHELLVACHDASLMLEYYLKACKREGLIDHLILTPDGTGHTAGVNACADKSSGDVFFHIANDIKIGPQIVDDCALKLRRDPTLGMIGWHWYNEGTLWGKDGLTGYQVRNAKQPLLTDRDVANIKAAPWYTGATFEALGAPLWLCLCNTAFFGMRKNVWDAVGGFSPAYKHYWADDFLNYAVLDQRLSVSHFERKWRSKEFFAETQYDHQDTEDRRRSVDSVLLPPWMEKFSVQMGGGLSIREAELIYQIARSTSDGANILHVGVWRGTGLSLFMEGMKHRPASITGIDCFDDGAVSAMSAQPPVSRQETVGYLQGFLSDRHHLELQTANTLSLSKFPQSDVIFLDAGHTEECVRHDLTLALKAIRTDGLIIVHDYGRDSFPAVKRVVDELTVGYKVRRFETLAIIEKGHSMPVAVKISPISSLPPPLAECVERTKRLQGADRQTALKVCVEEMKAAGRLQESRAAPSTLGVQRSNDEIWTETRKAIVDHVPDNGGPWDAVKDLLRVTENTIELKQASLGACWATRQKKMVVEAYIVVLKKERAAVAATGK